MPEYILLILGASSIGIGAIFGYFARQGVAKLQTGSLEQTINEKTREAKTKAEKIILEAKEKAFSMSQNAKNSTGEKEKELISFEHKLGRKQGILDQKISDFKIKKEELLNRERKSFEKEEKIKEILANKTKELEKISGITKGEAKKEIINEIKKRNEKEFREKFLKLEKEGEEKFKKRSREVLAFAVQKAIEPSLSEFTTMSVSLPDDEIKGRIIGKEGRNIRAFENSTGVEIVVDETPNAVFLSSFDPLRREIAKTSLQKLIKSGVIQPSKIEETVKSVEDEMPKKIRKIGEDAAMKAEVFGLDKRLYQLLGRLRFRTSFSQNVLGHSLEVSYLSNSLAEEIGANSKIAKKAGLLHDIGKAVDSQIEGSHVEIGIKILEKFKIEKEVIDAMKSHHEDYPYKSIEGVIVQTADAISASRMGARKDTSENYLQRLEDLEKIATSFPEVKTAYAIEAGREVRVFVKSEETDDFGARKLAEEIARTIEEDVKYPGEIKVNVIRETRVIEYAR